MNNLFPSCIFKDMCCCSFVIQAQLFTARLTKVIKHNLIKVEAVARSKQLKESGVPSGHGLYIFNLFTSQTNPAFYILCTSHRDNIIFKMFFTKLKYSVIK